MKIPEKKTKEKKHHIIKHVLNTPPHIYINGQASGSAWYISPQDVIAIL